MQAVMVVPRESETMLTRRVAGIPLMERILATAMRAGVRELVLFWPCEINLAIWEEAAAFPILRGLETIQIDSFPFDPKRSRSWNAIRALLKEDFLWLPWNFVTSSRFLAAIEASTSLPSIWRKPVRLTKELLGRNRQARAISVPQIEGVSIHSPDDVPSAERFLLATFGKPTDEIYSSFGRKLSRPSVGAMAHTGINPKVVKLARLVLAVISAFTCSREFYRRWRRPLSSLETRANSGSC